VIADARTAVAFLTRLPVGGRGLSGDGLSRAAAWFPAVGLLVGGVMAGTRALAGLVLDPAPATILAVAAAIATGGLHEDGLADAADAIGAHAGRTRRLEILRDPRVGTFGALALAFAVALQVALLAPLDDAHFARAALAGHVLGRWSILPQSRLLPAARPDGTGALVRATAPALALGSCTAIATALLAGGPRPGAIALTTAGAVTALGAYTALRALGGATGDTLGAVTKLVELSAYATLVASS
jgi:adenosylcobinamide-GDP ribazoletransferase